MEPNISIIVPVYNVDQYIEKCLISILEQTYKDFEVILINDGSTDCSSEICDQYKIKDCRVKVVHKKNGGLSSARNKGLDMAKGKYITFIDSDDWVDPLYLEILYSNLIKQNADISACSLLKARKENGIDVKDKDNRVTEFANKTILAKIHDNINYCVVCGKLYKRGLLDQIRFPVGKLHEDEFINYKLLYNAKRIIFSDSKLYYYRQRSNSIMGMKFNTKRLDILEAFYGRIEFYDEKSELELYKNELLMFINRMIKLYNRFDSYIKVNKKALSKFDFYYKKTLWRLILSGYREKDLFYYILVYGNKNFVSYK